MTPARRWAPFAEAPPEERVNDPKSIIAPGGDTHILRRRTLKPGEMDDIREGRKAIFFWGCVDYLDAFEEPRHFIFNCRMTGREGLLADARTNQSIVGWELLPHPAGYKAN